MINLRVHANGALLVVLGVRDGFYNTAFAPAL